MSAIEIPGYKILRTLGVGGQATVYLAIQTGFEREVALKIMSPILAADPTFGERFIREAKIVAKLSHKSIVTVYDAGSSGDFYYLAMEYMPGGDLKKRIENGLKARECLDIISQLALALHFAHQKGYVHRDVKSENILFNADNELVLTDFGIAKASNSSTQMTQTGKLIGTPEYMSPEQCRGKKLDGRSDLYSLGIILHEMLTRNVPFSGEDSVSICIKHVTSPIPELPVRLKHFQWLIDLLLAKDPDERFQSGAELAKAVNEFKKTGNTTTDIGIINGSETESKNSNNQSTHETVINDAINPKQFNDSLDESFHEEMHTEKRITNSTEQPQKNRTLTYSFLVVGLISILGFFTKDLWFKQTYQWIEVTFLDKPEKITQGSNNGDLANNQSTNPVISPNNNNNKVDEIDDNNATDKNKLQLNQQVISDNTDNSSELNSENKLNTTNLIDVLENADRLIQFEPHTLADLKQALKLITTVKTLEPDNKNANVLYQHILNLSLSQATMSAEKSHFKEADDWLSLVENEHSSHPLLAGAQQSIKSLKRDYVLKQNERDKRNLEIISLLDKAKQSLIENQLSTPENNNAIYFYNAVLALDSENIDAKNGIGKVESIYLSLIEEAINSNQFSQAKLLLVKYSSLSKDEANINNLQFKISKAEQVYEVERKEKQRLAAIEENKKLAEKQRLEKLADPLVQMQLSGFLDGAKQLEDSGILVEPENNNALDKYKNALSIDENNLVAKAGIIRVKQTIIDNLNNAINTNKRDDANNWLNQYRIIDPKSSKLETFEKAVINLQSQTALVTEFTESEIKDEPQANAEENNVDTSNNGELIQNNQDADLPVPKNSSGTLSDINQDPVLTPAETKVEQSNEQSIEPENKQPPTNLYRN